MPRDNPTVPIAEAVSNMQRAYGMPSAMLIMKAPVIVRKRYMRSSVAALFMVCSSILLPKICGLLLRRITAIEFATNTASVVVFMPPAVDPGDPPINISIIVTACPALDIAFKSAVLNPAVRGVTAWNTERQNLSFKP